MFSLLKNVNLGLAFFLELCMLAALCYFGFVVGPNVFAKVGLGIGVPIVVIVIWALFGAPTAKRRWQGSGYLILRVVLFGGTSIALYAAGQPILAIVFALLFVLNISLAYAWGQK